ncbi:MAG: beta strand repeat-containing protein [Candidatus Saccharimonadaceae bacterium]
MTGNVNISGNVGIGTTNPGSSLEVYKGHNYGLGVTDLLTLNNAPNGNSNDQGAIAFKHTDTGNGKNWYPAKIVGDKNWDGTNFSGSLLFQTKSSDTNQATLPTTKMRILENGNVGIGTISPTQKLDVSGKIALDGVVVAYRPTAFPGTLIIGDGGTNLSHTTGNEGYYNTFVGIGAGQANTTGRQNTANGHASLFYNTTGGYNTANGMYSLLANTTGNNNSAQGYQSLYSNTTGSNNTANGYQSLYSNTTGNNNTANGYASLLSNTTGNYNTANGMYSLNSNTTGIQNTAIGYASLYSNTTGIQNTAIGYASLYSNTTGSANTAQGVNAGRFIADGATGNVTGDSSLFLGANTKALADGQSNQIVIGYNATGIGSNTVTLGSDLIVTTALKGNVGIGTTTPIAQLTQKSTELLESAPLSAELTDTNLWTISAGWGEDYGTGFTHSAGGGITTLSRTMTNAIGSLYQISFTISGRTTGTVIVTLGGEASNRAFYSNAAQNYGPKTIATNGNLIFTPTTDFDGKISNISVKQILNSYSPIYVIQDSLGVNTFEIRSSPASLQNTFIGTMAGRYNTTGSVNIAIGHSALRANTTGGQNTAIGGYTLITNTTGYSNTAIGMYALQANTTSWQNTAIGTQALYLNTTGISNTGIGAIALYVNTTGMYNTAVGMQSLYSNIVGNYNTAIGVYTLLQNTGSLNTAVGYTAGRSLITGSSNTFLGYQAGYNALQLINASNSMALGFEAYTTASNQIVIGNDAITQTLLKGNVGIGTTTPSTQLHITGQFTSSLATGTAPFIVASTTLNTNLNADLLDGHHWSEIPTYISMVYPSVGIPLSTGTAWGTSIANNSANWNTAFGWGNHAGLYSLLAHNHTGVYAPIVHTHDDRYYTETESDARYPILSAGLIPSSYLPSYVDDVLEYVALVNFPVTGESGKIYVATDTNLTYRWSGTVYTEISASLALGETSATAYRGDRGKIAYDHSQTAHYSGTLTSIGMTVPLGLTVTPETITTSGIFTVTFTAGYSIPTTASQTNWNTAFS